MYVYGMTGEAMSEAADDVVVDGDHDDDVQSLDRAGSRPPPTTQQLCCDPGDGAVPRPPPPSGHDSHSAPPPPPPSMRQFSPLHLPSSTKYTRSMQYYNMQPSAICYF